MAEHLASIFGTEKDRVNCPFYFKIGACRHGDRCSRLHTKPSISPTLLLSNMYQRPEMLTAAPGTAPDLQLAAQNMDPRKIQEHYEDFYEDLFEELSKYGEIESLNICDNIADHMVGNVYVQFREEEHAANALRNLTGRFYAGRPIIVDFSPVTDFREATCRQYEENTCNRGGYCNFMHLKKISRELRRKLFGDLEEGTVGVAAHIGIKMLKITRMEVVALQGIMMGRTGTMKNEEGGLGAEAQGIRGIIVGAQQQGGGTEVRSGKVARRGGPRLSSGTEKGSRQSLLITTKVGIDTAMAMARMVTSIMISFNRIRQKMLTDAYGFLVWWAYLQVKMICSQCRSNLESFSSIKSLLHFMSIMLVQVKPSLCRKTWSCKKVSGTIFFFRLEPCLGRFLANMLSG